MSGRRNGVPSLYCCNGHEKSDSPYITFEYNEDTRNRLHNVLNGVSTYKDVEICISDNGRSKKSTVTIYTKNNKNKNEIFEKIAQELHIEKDIHTEHCTPKMKELIVMSDNLKEQNFKYSIFYNLGKRKLELEHLKDSNGYEVDPEKMKGHGFKYSKNLFNSTMYSKKISSGKNEVRDLGNVSKEILDDNGNEFSQDKLGIIEKIKRIFGKQKALPKGNVENEEYCTELEVFKDSLKTDVNNRAFEELNKEIVKDNDNELDER